MDDTGMDLGGHSYRHLIVYTQRTWPSTRGHPQVAWSVLSRWEELEPVVPKALLDAMCVLGLSWGWYRVVCVILITFHGCVRPCEVWGPPDLFLCFPKILEQNPVALVSSKWANQSLADGEWAEFNTARYEIETFRSSADCCWGLVGRSIFIQVHAVLLDTDGTTCWKLYLYPVLLV